MQYYCLDCHELHLKGVYEKEAVFTTGFFVLENISYHAGFCSVQQPAQEENILSYIA